MLAHAGNGRANSSNNPEAGHGRRSSMSPAIAECLEHARQCEWYADWTNNEADRKFLLWRAEEWTKLAEEKEQEVKVPARTTV